jgi:hypothetical protein
LIELKRQTGGPSSTSVAAESFSIQHLSIIIIIIGVVVVHSASFPSPVIPSNVNHHHQSPPSLVSRVSFRCRLHSSIRFFLSRRHPILHGQSFSPSPLLYDLLVISPEALDWIGMDVALFLASWFLFPFFPLDSDLLSVIIRQNPILLSMCWRRPMMLIVRCVHTYMVPGPAPPPASSLFLLPCFRLSVTSCMYHHA